MKGDNFSIILGVALIGLALYLAYEALMSGSDSGFLQLSPSFKPSTSDVNAMSEDDYTGMVTSGAWKDGQHIGCSAYCGDSNFWGECWRWVVDCGQPAAGTGVTLTACDPATAPLYCRAGATRTLWSTDVEFCDEFDNDGNCKKNRLRTYKYTHDVNVATLLPVTSVSEWAKSAHPSTNLVDPRFTNH